MRVDLRRIPAKGAKRDDVLLFSESPGRFVVTVEPSKRKKFEACLKGTKKALVGEVLSPQSGFTIVGLNGMAVIRSSIEHLKNSWQRPLKW